MPAPPLPGIPEEVRNIGITERLGASVSIAELEFTDETGTPVRLSRFFSKDHPVVLNLGYYGCPTLCSVVLNGLLEALRASEWTPGEKFEVVTLSIDPKEDAGTASAKKESYLESYGRPAGAQGWHFLTGKEAAIRKLAEQVGFGYKYDEKEKQYAHGAGIIVLTPEGKVSRYLYGVKFEPKDFKLALLEASQGRIGTVMERIQMLCYRYDPKLRKYSVYVTRLMQTGAAGTLILFGGYMTLFWRRERKKREPDSHV